NPPRAGTEPIMSPLKVDPEPRLDGARRRQPSRRGGSSGPGGLAAAASPGATGPGRGDLRGVSEAQFAAGALVERRTAQPDHLCRRRAGPHVDPLTRPRVPGNYPVYLYREAAADRQ